MTIRKLFNSQKFNLKNIDPFISDAIINMKKAVVDLKSAKQVEERWSNIIYRQKKKFIDYKKDKRISKKFIKQSPEYSIEKILDEIDYEREKKFSSSLYKKRENIWSWYAYNDDEYIEDESD